MLFYCLDQQRKHQKRSKVQYLKNHHPQQLKQVKKAVFAPFDQESLETHRAKFHLLIKRYLNPDQGFTARRAMFRIEDNSDYDGISRFGEWSIEDKTQ